MNAAILYGCKEKLSRHHMSVTFECDYFVRLEIFRDLPRETDLGKLLDKATPEDEETVLNTVWL